MTRSGWLTFAGVMMIIAGVMRVLDAIWAFRYKGTTVDNLHQAIFGHSLTTYGWIWLIVGVVLIVAGLVLMGTMMTGSDGMREAARWIGVVAAGVTAITAVSWLAYYPIWSLVYIGISVTVIYALLARYQDEINAAR
jgi:hypothetical protein